MNSSNIIDKLLTLSNQLLLQHPIPPHKVALKIEEIAADAWSEAEAQGYPTWKDIEDLAPSLRIDP